DVDVNQQEVLPPRPRLENGGGEPAIIDTPERSANSKAPPAAVDAAAASASGASTSDVATPASSTPTSTKRSEDAEALFPETTAVLEVASTDEVLEIDSAASSALIAELTNDSQLPVPGTTAATGIAPGNELLVRTDRLRVIPVGPPTPDPMVVQSLEAALREIEVHPEIRVIELHCNRYEAKPLTIDLRSDLTIEAGKGFSPLLVFDRREPSALGERRMVHLLGGRLTLRGLHFRVDLPYTSESGWAMFHLHQVQDLTLERCTLTIQNDYRADAAFFHIQSPRMPEMPIPGSDALVPPRPNINLESCIARGEATFVRATEGLPFKLDFSQGLLATSERMIELGQRSEAIPQEIARVFLRHVTAEMGFGLCRATLRDADARLPQLSINAENCLLDHNANAPLLEHAGVRDVAATISYAIDLRGNSNAYPRTEVLWRIEPREGASVEIAWDDRLDTDNAWYKETVSETYAPWLDTPRKLDRVMHEITPSDYLVADGEEMGFHPAELPDLPPND
ncbi:MAG: hypothetical protein HYV60_02885, partial [Planctomycetia bacterium]|nr:hypothetical protein [Planctomycetia bacterium]